MDSVPMDINLSQYVDACPTLWTYSNTSMLIRPEVMFPEADLETPHKVMTYDACLTLGSIAILASCLQGLKNSNEKF